ncbi:MAG: shikimate dehydrogenase [Thermoguttaceae bacterium]
MAVSNPPVQPVLVLLSHPVSGNPTQYMMEKALAHHQLDWRYLSLDVSPENIEDAIRGIRAMGFSGGHCADPHKQTVPALLDRLTEKAEMIGAVNLIFREEDELVGDNTEGQGFIESLRRMTDPAEKKVVLLGAGRMARAVGVELAAADVAEITIANRDPSPARDLAKLLAEKFQVGSSAVQWEEDFELPAEIDLLINATSIGHEDPDARVPLNLESLSGETIVADVTTDPPRTPLLGEAAQCGCRTLDGLSMYIDQVAAGFKLWTGVEPDLTVMREAIEEFLEV